MRLIPIVALGLLFIGCTGSGRFTAMNQESAALSAPAKTFKVGQVASKAGVSDSVNTLITKELEKQFKAAMAREKLEYAESQADLTIDIQVMQIRAGNAAVRYFLGPFFGKGDVQVLIKTTDRDGKEWLSGEGEGTVTGGGWGGKIQSTCKRIAIAYVKEYKKRAAAATKVAGN